MKKDKIEAILELHKNAVNSVKEAYKEAEHNCRENTFMDSGEADSYINYVRGIEAVMELLNIPVPDWDLEDDDEDEEEPEMSLTIEYRHKETGLNFVRFNGEDNEEPIQLYCSDDKTGKKDTKVSLKTLNKEYEEIARYMEED